uniref:FH2 domain containing 3 n=1 Tax=Xiphophorus couchianus TaxID=32473 RepID=A0A3B5LUQ3_9TELE
MKQYIKCDPFLQTALRSMKKLNWDTLPNHHVLGKLNVWTSKRTQRDLVLDIQTMEELFSHDDKSASLRASKVFSLSKSDGMNLCGQESQVTNRYVQIRNRLSMQALLSFSFFMSLPVSEIVEDIRQGNWQRFGNGKLKDLCKLLPEESEVTGTLFLLIFHAYIDSKQKYGRAMVLWNSFYGERLKVMLLREEFFPLMEEVKNAIAVMIKAANELLDCDDLHSVIRLVLKAGNYMNAGGYSANAIGFRVASLLNLADTKANKPGMNLMHYVAKFVSEFYQRICKDDVIKDLKEEIQKMEEVKLFSSIHPGLLQQIDQFLKRADTLLADVDLSLNELKALSDAVAGYFCEDPATFKLEECCSIFYSFCKRFDKAVQENREREAVEHRHKRSESIQLVVKRRSVASCSALDPTDDSCLESALHNLLSKPPSGLSRCRKNYQPQAKGLRSESCSQTSQKEMPILCKTTDSPEKKQTKLLKDVELAKLEEEEVLCYQNVKSNRNDEKVSGSPQHSKGEQDEASTPRTPSPRTRDYFFTSNGNMGSPWTILSPISCSPRSNSLRGKARRGSSTSSGNDPDDGVWEIDETNLKNYSSQESLTSPSGGSASLPECIGQRALSQGPLLRSASVDQTLRSPGMGFRLRYLFQRNVKERSDRKVENYAEGSSGLKSLFKLIGSRSKLCNLDEKT